MFSTECSGDGKAPACGTWDCNKQLRAKEHQLTPGSVEHSSGITKISD